MLIKDVVTVYGSALCNQIVVAIQSGPESDDLCHVTIEIREDLEISITDDDTVMVETKS